MPTLKLISSMAPRELLRALIERYQAGASHAVDATAAGGVDVAKRVRAGEAVDIVVLARNAIDELGRDGAVLTDSITDLARSGIGVAVPDGAPSPDLGDEAGVRRAVLAARTLAYSTGPSGVYLERKFEAWGILGEIKPRIVVPPPGVPVAELIATGKATLGFQQLSELIHAPGIKVVGLLPPALQLMTTFSAAVTRVSGQAALARELLAFMTLPQHAEAATQAGMEQCTVPVA